MKTPNSMVSVFAILVPVSVTITARAPGAPGVGTAVTYQGQLKQNGAPAHGNPDMEFRLFDAATIGTQVGNPVTLPGVAVANGLFTVTLNAAGEFGPTAFNGENRWLQITVDGTTLTPRQAVTAAPYAATALSIVGLDGHSLDASDGSPVDAVFVDDVGHVGIGTQVPVAGLHVEGPGYPNSFLFLNSSGGNNDSGLRLMRDGDVYWHVFNRESTGDSFSLHNANFDPILAATQDGKVGIGTPTPTTQLEVNGATRTTTLEITGGSPLEQSLAGWGDNTDFQINVPVGTFTAVAAGGSHSLAIRSDGTLVGWGDSLLGQSNVPIGKFTAIAAGQYHSLAIRTDGTLSAWPAGLPETDDVPTGTFIAVAAGYRHSLAIRSDGTLVGWGSNAFGQINVPSGIYTVVAAGQYHSLAISDNGTLVGWGTDPCGLSNVPAGTFTAIAAGQCHSLAIRSNGTLVGWGSNNSGQVIVPTGTFTAVAGGQFHSIAIRSNGTLAGWGNNGDEQISVPSGTFVSLAAGSLHSLAIRSDPTPGNFGLQLATNSAAKPGSNTWTIWSDRRLKKNIEPLSGALDRLLQLHGVTFQWVDPASQGGITGTQMGLIADEVQRAFPQWVGRDPKGYQTLTVGGFEALTAEAFRDLRQEKDAAVRKLQEENAELRELLKRVTERIDALEGGR